MLNLSQSNKVFYNSNLKARVIKKNLVKGDLTYQNILKFRGGDENIFIPHFGCQSFDFFSFKNILKEVSLC
jgi:hypothetical protein